MNTAESGRMRAGGPEQYQGLVVPPQRNATGDERPSTAKVLEKGNAAEYQRSYGRTMGLAKVHTDTYRLRLIRTHTQSPQYAHSQPACSFGS